MMSIYYITVVLVVARLNIVLAQSKCPTFKPIENFDFDKYVKGTWYEIARFENKFENGSCVSMNTTKKGNGYQMELREIINKKLYVFEAIIVQDKQDRNIGRLKYILEGYQGESNILAVDYNNYSVEYYCTYDESTGTLKESGWIGSRTKELNLDFKSNIHKVLQALNVFDNKKIFWDDFSDESCRYTSQDIQRTLSSRLLKRLTSN